MRIISRRQAALFLLGITLTACNSPQLESPLQVTLQNVSANQVLSGTTQVQVSVEGGTASRVTLYARDAGNRELPLTSTSTQPYTLTLHTKNYPNQTPFQLFARASSGSKDSDSTAIPVIIQNADAPQLRYFVTLTYPRVAITNQSLQTGSSLRPIIQPDKVRWTGTSRLFKTATQTPLRPLAVADYITDVEWGWNAVTNAYGYGVFVSAQTIMGSFERIKNQSPGPQALQGAVHNIATVPGQWYTGAVTQLVGSSETALSNAITAPILQPQDALSPANGTTVSDGRPTLSWMKNPDADAYQYFVYNRNPEHASVTPLWSNDTTATPDLSVFYPADRDPLPSGTYYWRVAGIQFRQGVPVAYSFSPILSFRIP